MVYLDNAGTTIVDEKCLEIYEKYQKELYFNPSAQYHDSLMLTREIKNARENIIKNLKAESGKVIFTSSGSESDNLALFGTKKSKNGRIIVSKSEHPAVFNAANELLQRGYDVVFCNVDNTGRVIEEEFIKVMTPNTELVSIMHVNNETGCVNDIKKLCQIAKKVNKNVIFHSDGVQAVGKVKVNLRELGVDLYTISGHKIHAMKGIAGLYIKEGINIKPLIFGGGQEFGIRSSTENVGGIMALNYAIENAVKKSDIEIKELRADLSSFFQEEGFYVVESTEQSSYIICAAMPKVRGEVMLHSLEKYGIYIGTGSACSSKNAHKKLPQMLGLTPEYENGIIRISFSDLSTKNDIDYFKNCIKKEYKELLNYVQ